MHNQVHNTVFLDGPQFENPERLMVCGSILLVVEDDRDIRESIVDLLAMEGYIVHSASNGKEALDALRTSQKPCLILLDLMMPVMDGWEFLEIKRHQNMIASIPVLVTSAVADRAPADDKVVGRIRKPVNLEALLQIVSIYCGAGATGTSSIHAAG